MIRRRPLGTILGPCAPKHQNDTLDSCFETYYQSLKQLPCISLVLSLLYMSVARSRTCMYVVRSRTGRENNYTLSCPNVTASSAKPAFGSHLAYHTGPRGTRMTQQHKNVCKFQNRNIQFQATGAESYTEAGYYSSLVCPLILQSKIGQQ